MGVHPHPHQGMIVRSSSCQIKKSTRVRPGGCISVLHFGATRMYIGHIGTTGAQQGDSDCQTLRCIYVFAVAGVYVLQYLNSELVTSYFDVTCTYHFMGLGSMSSVKCKTFVRGIERRS